MKTFFRSLIGMFFSLFLVLALTNHVSASEPSKLFLDGNRIESEVAPVNVEGVTLVPLAVISKGLGQDVVWENSTKRVTITAPSLVIQLQIGQAGAKVNSDEILLPKEAVLMHNRTMVPLRFISEALGLTVHFDDKTKDISIISPASTKPEENADDESTNASPSPSPSPDVNHGSDASAKATIQSVIMDEEQSIFIHYKGELTQPKVMELDSPRRVVIDLPNTNYVDKINQSFEHGMKEIKLTDSEIMNSYRYSLFSNSPVVSRIVVELKEGVPYQLVHENGYLSIVFGDLVQDGPTVPELSPPAATTPSDQVYRIVLDAGHGGSDPGSINKGKGLNEKTFNLALVLLLKKELEKYKKVEVYLTRSDDTFIELDDRVAFAQSIPGVGKPADLFISVHANSFTKPDVTGTETYWYHENSKKLAETLHPYVVNTMKLSDRGVKTAGFKVIKYTTMPSVLLEVGYMSNENDVTKLFNQETQKKLAVELAKGVASYLKLQ